LVEHRVGFGLQGRTAGFKCHALQHERRARWGEEDGAAHGVDLGAGRRTRALVLAVVHAVAVGVLRELAPRRVYFGPGGRIGTLVEPVVDAVLIAVQRAPGPIDRCPRRGGGTLVEPVVHAVLVTVCRTAGGVDRSASGRAG